MGKIGKVCSKHLTFCVGAAIAISLLAACSSKDDGAGDVKDNSRSVSTEIDAKRQKSCSDSYDVAESLLNRTDRFLAAVEGSHQSRIAKADRLLAEAQSNPIYEMTGVGLEAKFKREDDARSAQVALLREKKAVVGAFLQLEEHFAKTTQSVRVMDASGKSEAIDQLCSRATRALNEASTALQRVQKASRSVSRLANDELAVLTAAKTRISLKQ